MPHITTRDGTRLYVKDWGQGRPVILIHGWPLSADSWDAVAMELADKGFRAIAYDRRGFGRSDQPWTGYDYDTLSDDLADVMAETGVTDGASIIGFSMGGGEVARYLSRHGGKGVVQAGLIGSVVPGMLKSETNPHGVPKNDLDQIGEQVRADRAKFFRSFFKDFYGVGLASHPVSDATIDASWNVAMQASLKATLACAESFGGTDFVPDLSAFTVPTLVIHGTSDATVPIDATARRVKEYVPTAELFEYDGAPHGLFATHERRLIDDLSAFLRSA